MELELHKVRIIGAGSIGNHLLNSFLKDNVNIIGTTTNIDKINNNTIYVENNNLENLNNLNQLNIIIWAHGYNFNDNIDNFDYNNRSKCNFHIKYTKLFIYFTKLDSCFSL